MVFIVKIKLGDDTRRISLERVPTYEELIQIAKQLFGLQSDFVVKYEDDEKDLVTITSEIELREALTVISKTDSILRLTIAERPKTFSAKPQEKSTQSQQSGPANVPFNPAMFFTPEVVNDYLRQLFGQNASVNDLTNMLGSLGLGGSTGSQQQCNPENVTNFLQQILGNAPWLKDVAQEFLKNVGGAPVPPTAPPADNSNVNNNNDTNNNNNNDAPAVHAGVVCDGCNASPLIGIRFKCSVCNDYDLCEKCEAKGAKVHDPSHPLLKIPHPPAHGYYGFGGRFGRGCPYPRRCERPRHLARYVQDVSIPDGSVILPGASFVKTWKMRNEGSSAWPEQTTLAFVGGDKISVYDSVLVALPPPGQEVDISVDMIAPSVPGRYVSYWRLSGLDGARFGHRVWVDIIVEAVPSPVPTIPSDVPVPIPVPAPVPVPVYVPSPAPIVPSAVPVPIPVPAPVLTPVNPPAPEPMVIAPSPVPVPVSVPVMTSEEAVTVRNLEEMGFRGDLIGVLRKNQGDFLRTVNQLLGTQ